MDHNIAIGLDTEDSQGQDELSSKMMLGHEEDTDT